jgi:SAM-dependent methyltransferase
MQTDTLAQYWNANAEAWTVLARAGYDLYRDHLNTPAFFEMLPAINGLEGLDIGCGEGHNTRLLAARGATMHAIDIAEIFIAHATRSEQEQPLGITYATADAAALPYADARFDFATSFMCYMDLPNPEAAFAEAWRVLKPGGFLQFSIAHPCYATPYRRNLRNAAGQTYAFEIGDYFNTHCGKVEEWIFGAAPDALKNQFPKFKIPVFNRTLSELINLLLDTGFTIERMQEPRPSDELTQKLPYIQDAQVLAYFLQLRVRKNGKINQVNKVG